MLPETRNIFHTSSNLWRTLVLKNFAYKYVTFLCHRYRIAKQTEILLLWVNEATGNLCVIKRHRLFSRHGPNGDATCGWSYTIGNWQRLS